MITSFVLIMMLLIEYLNVQTRGAWQKKLRKSRFGQYSLGAFLGVTPGCLGAFTVVSLYSHRAVGFGALVAAMIATSGDEAFVMFSMFPLQALWLSAILFVVALAAGWLSDSLFRTQERFLAWDEHELELHEEEICHCFFAAGRRKDVHSYPGRAHGLGTPVYIFSSCKNAHHHNFGQRNPVLFLKSAYSGTVRINLFSSILALTTCIATAMKNNKRPAGAAERMAMPRI